MADIGDAQTQDPVMAVREQSLGSYLEAARCQRRMSLRALASASGVPMSTVNRLLKDQVGKIRPANLTAIAVALGVPAAEVFRRAGVVLPCSPASAGGDLDALLRDHYGLPNDVIAEIRGHVEDAARGAEPSPDRCYNAEDQRGS